jgi:hypothetical protein
MRKLLPILAMVALIAAVVLVARLDKDYDATGKGYYAKCVQGSEPSTDAGSFVCTIRPGQKAEQGESGPEWWHVLLTWPDGITAWALILTLYVFTWQAVLMRKHAEHFRDLAEKTADTAQAANAGVLAANKAYTLADDTAKRQLRAYISVKDARLVLHEDGQVEAAIEFYNCGQTPAYQLQIAHAHGFSSYPLQKIPDPPVDLRKSNSLVGAGNGFYALMKPAQHLDLDREALLAEFQHSNFVFCVRGLCTYRDIFKESHSLRFQLIVGGPSGSARLNTDAEGRLYAALCNDSEGNEGS